MPAFWGHCFWFLCFDSLCNSVWTYSFYVVSPIPAFLSYPSEFSPGYPTLISFLLVFSLRILSCNVIPFIYKIMYSKHPDTVTAFLIWLSTSFTVLVLLTSEIHHLMYNALTHHQLTSDHCFGYCHRLCFFDQNLHIKLPSF